MKITAYNKHRGLLPFQLSLSSTQDYWFRSEPSLLSNQVMPSEDIDN